MAFSLNNKYLLYANEVTYFAAKLTSGIFGHFNYPFPKHCLLQRQRKHRVQQGCHLDRYPSSNLDRYPSSNTTGITWGTRRSRGEHRPMHGIYFVFHTPAVAPLPVAGCPRAASTTAVSLPSPWLPSASATLVCCLCTPSPRQAASFPAIPLAVLTALAISFVSKLKWPCP